MENSESKVRREGHIELDSSPQVHTSSRFDWFCRCLLLAALIVPLPTSLDGVWVVAAAEDSGRSERGRGMWEVLELSKSGSLPLPMVLLGVPLKVPVCDILMPGMGKNTTKMEKKGRRRVEQHEEMRNRYEQRKWANCKGVFSSSREGKRAAIVDRARGVQAVWRCPPHSVQRSPAWGRM